MKRRHVLRLPSVCLALGSAGCTRLPFTSRSYSLWFVRVHNGTPSKVGIGIEIDRDGESLFGTRFETIPSFRATEEQEASFAEMDSARLIEDEWEPRPGRYTVQYRLSTDETTRQFRLSSVESFDARHVGLDLQLLGGARTAVTTSPNVLTFDSEQQVTEFLETVTTDTPSD